MGIPSTAGFYHTMWVSYHTMAKWVWVRVWNFRPAGYLCQTLFICCGHHSFQLQQYCFYYCCRFGCYCFPFLAYWFHVIKDLPPWNSFANIFCTYIPLPKWSIIVCVRTWMFSNFHPLLKQGVCQWRQLLFITHHIAGWLFLTLPAIDIHTQSTNHFKGYIFHVAIVKQY